MSETTEVPFRLALRSEGDHWNAYVANQGTMVGAHWIGSIHLKFVKNNEKRRQDFIDIMNECMSDIVEEIFGCKPDEYVVRPGPEHERTKGDS